MAPCGAIGERANAYFSGSPASPSCDRIVWSTKADSKSQPFRRSLTRAVSLFGQVPHFQREAPIVRLDSNGSLEIRNSSQPFPSPDQSNQRARFFCRPPTEAHSSPFRCSKPADSVAPSRNQLAAEARKLGELRVASASHPANFGSGVISELVWSMESEFLVPSDRGQIACAVKARIAQNRAPN